MADMQTIADIQAQKKILRREMRRRRRALGKAQQKQAALSLYKRMVVSKAFRFARRITFTLARDGEISPHLLLKEAQRRGKQCYLPVMNKLGEDRLRFRLLGDDKQLRSRNRFGIPEPVRGKVCRPRALSLVLLPLVAFDANCNRLGMGKGFYDHTLSFLQRSVRRRPLLIGLAHELQRVEALELAPWDVPLQAIATDKAWYKAPIQSI